MRDVSIEVPTLAPSRGFGTFLGVFTPSLLTILGVILYQRLGWVVGNAGWLGAISVVLLAHVISITTGLSVASIATNRTVQTGGNYYIISRSLGLSVGGALGLALYAALALGVSLYLIGFAEALLAVVDYRPMAREADNIRLVGTGALVVLAGLTWWSTGLALKSQLFVMVAIALSLASIFLGQPLPLAEGQHPVQMRPPEGTPTFAAVFAVFFPAVTGFTAGVGMSGDLRDPKRSIPAGTIAAIGVGLVIYLALTGLLALWVPSEELRADFNILRRVAIRPELVTLGVFAATLSSALGSLLGAPRTLQALAFDRIVPEWLGAGKNEPRVALAITLLIGEAGILIAELEVVGAVISMFFLTCYGFLCLACGLERWASPDFRPQFKVPIWVSLAGAVSCFLVMFQIDPLAMFGAVVVMAGLYAGLKRRQLVLGTGDTWGGIWSAVVRMGLMRLQQSASRTAQRNWRPTMLVVGRQRPQNPLLDFGTQLVGDRGILTHVHLVEGEKPSSRPDKVLEEAYPGIFARVQGCEDVFDSIPQLAANFGLVGMETNSVLLGWPRQASSRSRYAEMIDRLVALDLSVLMLRLDEKRGFGKRQQLDIWWDGEASTGPLMLTLAHMLTTHPSWQRTRVRVLVNGRPGQDEDRAQRELNAIIQESRVHAEGVLLPPVQGQEALAERIRQESSRADLVMIHAQQPRDELGFVAANDHLMRPLGTTLLVRPSTFFAQKATVFDAGTTDLGAVEPQRVSVPTPVPELLEPIRAFEQRLGETTERFARDFDRPVHREESLLVEDVLAEVEDIHQLARRLEKRGSRRAAARGLLEWARSRFASAVEERLRSPFRPPGKTREEMSWERRAQAALQRLVQDVEQALARLPDVVQVPTDLSDWLPNPKDGWRMRWRKFWVRTADAWLKRRPPPRRVPVRRPAQLRFYQVLQNDLDPVLRTAGVRRQQALHRVRRMVLGVQRMFDNLLAELDQKTEEEVDVEALAAVVSRQLNSMLGQARTQLEGQQADDERAREVLKARFEAASDALSELLEAPGTRQVPARPSASPDPAPWAEQHRALLGGLRLDLQVEACVIEARRALGALETRVQRELHQGPLGAIEQATAVMRRVVELRERYESEFGEPGSADVVPTEGNQEPAWAESFVQAADELRTAFDRSYRPQVQEMLEQLLAHLARGAERVPVSVSVLTDTAVEESLAGRTGKPPTVLAARRSAQSYLEAQVAEPVQRKVKALPEAVRQTEEVLVDAVRLVAFELEQVAAAGREDRAADVEEAGRLALGGTLEERIQRLEEAKQKLEAFAAELRAEVETAAGEKLEGVRAAVFGSGQQRSATAPRRSVNQWLRVARSRAEGLRGRVARATENLTAGGAPPRLQPSTVVDQVLRLREALAPDPELQASLPLLYRRIFGRSALENRDLMVGRDRELEGLNEFARRWTSGFTGPVGVLGDPRSGRTSLLTVWAREQDRPVLRVVAPAAGASTAEALNQAVARATGAREGQSAEGALRAQPPGAVVLVDDLGLWVERSVGGLAALKHWLRIFRRLGDRHLFVVSATPFVFDFASAVLGMDQVFLGTVACGPLERSELQEALRLRQRTTDFELEFTRGGPWRSNTERLQLERIYSRSRGNVGEAVDLWRRSVKEVTERRIRLEVQPAPDAGILQRLPPPWLAGLGTVAFHRGLTAAQLSRVFRNSREEAQALLSDLNRASLVRSERAGVFELDPLLQGPVLHALRRRGVLP